METFATQNRSHMGATAGQSFSAPGGKFWNISQLILLTGQKLYKEMSHLCFQPSSLQYLYWLGMTFQMGPLTINITILSNTVSLIQVSQTTYHVLSHLLSFPHIVLPYLNIPSPLRFQANCFLSFDSAQVSLWSLLRHSLEEVRLFVLCGITAQSPVPYSATTLSPVPCYSPGHVLLLFLDLMSFLPEGFVP